MTSNLVPPTELLFDGTSSRDEFIRFGEGFCRDFVINRARLQPTSAILDIGCGNGGVARPLTQFLTPPGRYEGIDVNRAGIEWLRDHYRPFPHFTFQHVDVRNSMYRPDGSVAADQYQLPFPDHLFDVVLLKSVFTHMLPPGVRSYLREIGRVLKPGGRAVLTFFLLSEESRACMAMGLDKMGLRCEWQGDPSCRVASESVPEVTVAHDETRVREWCAAAGLVPVEISFGDWSGRPTLIGLQDVLVAVKS